MKDRKERDRGKRLTRKLIVTASQSIIVGKYTLRLTVNSFSLDEFEQGSRL